MHIPLTAADRLAAVRNNDGTVDWLKVGEAEQARRTGQAASQDLLDCLDWLHANGGTFYVAMAAERYAEHVKATVREQGGVIVSEVSRTVDGRRMVTRTVRRFRPKGIAPMVAGRTVPRAREHRPGRARRAASSSSSSGSDPGDPDPEPEPSGELRHVSVPLAAELSRIADRLRARGGVG